MRQTAEKTFDNAKFVLYNLLRANPIMSRKQVAEKIGFVLDSCVSQICHLMDWDYETNYGLVYDHIVNKNGEFVDLHFEINNLWEVK